MTCPSLLVMTGWQVALAAVTGSPPCMHSMSIPLSCVLCARCCPCMHSACIVCMHSVPSAMAELTPCHALPYWRLAGRWRWLLWRGPCHAQLMIIPLSRVLRARCRPCMHWQACTRKTYKQAPHLCRPQHLPHLDSGWSACAFLCHGLSIEDT